MSEIVALYADGGVVRGKGGTWAFCGVNAAGVRILERSGVCRPWPDVGDVTNNHTEQFAIVSALAAVPPGWSGTLYSDSKIAIGRVFWNWRTENLPDRIAKMTAFVKGRIGRVKPMLLQGHPTKIDLEKGYGKKRGLPVSIHNVWCDEACNEAKKVFYEVLND
jgi:ribonuclease HI